MPISLFHLTFNLTKQQNSYFTIDIAQHPKILTFTFYDTNITVQILSVLKNIVFHQKFIADIAKLFSTHLCQFYFIYFPFCDFFSVFLQVVVKVLERLLDLFYLLLQKHTLLFHLFACHLVPVVAHCQFLPRVCEAFHY